VDNRNRATARSCASPAWLGDHPEPPVAALSTSEVVKPPTSIWTSYKEARRCSTTSPPRSSSPGSGPCSTRPAPPSPAGATRISYTADLRHWFGWCHAHDLDVFAIRRGHLELWARMQEDGGLAPATISRRLSTVAGFYRFAAIDGVIEHSPAEYVRRPKIDTQSATLGLDRMELSAFIVEGAAAGPVDHALACLLGLQGLRVSEACGIDIEDLSAERGHRTVTVLGIRPVGGAYAPTRMRSWRAPH
jgi:hypothetical protein